MRDATAVTGQHPPRFIPVWAVAAILQRPHRTIRSWVAAGHIPSKRDPDTGALLVDGEAATRRHEQTPTRHRTSGVSVIDTVKSTESPSALKKYAQIRPGPRTAAGLSCVRGRGGVVAGNDQTPDMESLVPNEIVVPVSLDLSKAETQLSAFCDRVVRDISQAVATGLSVHSMTVVLAPPPTTD